MEHQTGVVLFNRESTGYKPTDEGLSLANKARLISQDVENAYLKLAGEDLRISGTIRIATSDFLEEIFLTKALGLLRQRYPEITAEIIVSSQFTSLGKRDADVAFRAITKSPKGLKGKSLTTLQYSIYSHKKLINEVYELSDLKWISDDDTITHSQLRYWQNSIIANPDVILKANSTMAKFNAVKQGIGVSLLPDLLGESDENLVCIHSNPLWKLDIWFLSHNDLYNLQRIKALESALIDVISCNS